MKQKHNNKQIPNTEITVEEFKKLIFEKFKAYPLMRLDYRKNQFEIVNTFYENISITQDKLIPLCEEIGIKYELEYSGWCIKSKKFVPRAIVIKL